MIYGRDNPDSWNDAVSLFPDIMIDSYYDLKYFQLYAKRGFTDPILFVYESQGAVYISPFLLHTIISIEGFQLPNPILDLETAYGYGGPIATTHNREFLYEANKAFVNWCQQAGITGEFIRFHPILRSHEFSGLNTIIEKNRTTYSITIQPKLPAIEHFHGTARNRARGALKNNLYVHELSIKDDISNFKSLYLETMNRVNANTFYLFSDEYFTRLSNFGDDKLKMVAVSDSEGIHSIAVFLIGKNGIHYHLGASSSRKTHSGAFNLLMMHAVELGLLLKLKWVHLGGGKSSDGTDSLSHFKRTLSDTTHDYYIGRRLHQPDVWQRAHGKLHELNLSIGSSPKFFEYHFYP